MSNAPRFSRSLMISLAVHTSVLLLVMFAVHGAPHITSSSNVAKKGQPKTKIIHAVAINGDDIQHEMARLRRQRALQKQREVARVHRLQRQAQLAKKKRHQELRRVQALKAKRKRLAEKKAADAKRLQQLKQQRAETEKHLAALQAKAKQAAKAQAENKRIAAAKAAKLVAQKRAQEAMKKQLAEQLAKEQAQLDAVANQHVQTLVAKYTGLIRHSIAQQWRVPASAKKKMSARLLLKLSPGGTVIRVSIEKTSGDTLFDSSAIAAVRKASPLPVPSEDTAFDKFRVLHLTVRPDDVRATQTG